MKLSVFPILLLGVLYFSSSHAYRILGLIPLDVKSHFVMFERIMKSLAERGHHVDVVSHFPQKKPFPNYHDIVSLAGTMPDFVNNVTMKMVEEDFPDLLLRYKAGFFGRVICELLDHPKMKELVRNPPQDKPYDLVISQVYTSQCYLAFGHHLKVPVIGLSTSTPYPWMNQYIGNPDNPAYVPNALQGFVPLTGFWERLLNTVHTISHKLLFNYHTSSQDAMVQKYFSPDTPGVRELERGLALLLVNSHHSLNGARPLAQSVVEIGGVHIGGEVQELSPELEEWLDESKEGFVHFTFGSMVKIETFSKEVLEAIYASFAKIAPIRVLMKIAKKDELPPGLPENVMTLSWIPQYQVLKHKNVRAFITHGGLLGIQEAVVSGVPMIGIPLFVDQNFNINLCVQKKIAVYLYYKDITVKKLDDALSAILYDPSYREEARKLSTQFLDRPMSPIDTAIFWIEYVVRNGPNSLRSPILDLSWWQVALLDVFGFMLLVVSLAAYTLKIFVKKMIARVSGKMRKIYSKTKKKA